MSTPNGNWESNRKYVLESIDALDEKIGKLTNELNEKLTTERNRIDKLERFKIQAATVFATVQVIVGIVLTLLKLKK